MKSNQLADGVMSFAQERPDLHAKPLLGALLQYLASVCGDNCRRALAALDRLKK